MRWWKALGLAGMAGVAATGVIAVRNERRRRAYTPEEVRARLHERLAAGSSDDEVEEGDDGEDDGDDDGDDNEEDDGDDDQPR
jgi:hypothetical protein